MENIAEEEKTSSTNRSITKRKNKSLTEMKERYFLIKKCERNNSTFLGKKTLIRKKIRKISPNKVNEKTNTNENNANIMLNENIKKKFINIQFNNIKKLCEYIIINFSLLFNNKIKDEKNKDKKIYQIWQCLNILNNKIYYIKKENLFKPEKKELENFIKIKDILTSLKKNLSEKMAKNLRCILNNIENFCIKYSK